MRQLLLGDGGRGGTHKGFEASPHRAESSEVAPGLAIQMCADSPRDRKENKIPQGEEAEGKIPQTEHRGPAIYEGSHLQRPRKGRRQPLGEVSGGVSQRANVMVNFMRQLDRVTRC